MDVLAYTEEVIMFGLEFEIFITFLKILGFFIFYYLRFWC